VYGKSTESAIAALSRLAEVYDGGRTRLSVDQIADSRGLQRPFTAKLLSGLAQAGLVHGARGPGGGFTLARDPRKITLYDVYRLFERADDEDSCAFGGDCLAGDPCALHDRLTEIANLKNRFLRETSFEEFRAAFQETAGSDDWADSGRRRAPARATRKK
jgi:Rrf2 family protein